MQAIQRQADRRPTWDPQPSEAVEGILLKIYA